MSENAEERWGRPIANDELKPELLPERNALWSELVFFAGTLNGYEVAGESPAELLAFADPIAQRWLERGELPNDLTALRVALFAKQRRDHFSDSATDPRPCATSTRSSRQSACRLVGRTTSRAGAKTGTPRDER